MNIAQVNLIAVIGRQGFIGNAGERPELEDEEAATGFQERFLDMVTGGSVVLGGRTHQMLIENGFKPKEVPFDVIVWDREAQEFMAPEDLIGALAVNSNPIFIAGGFYTFQTFMPWVEQMFLTRAALTVGAEPLYMPELFQKTQ